MCRLQSCLVTDDITDQGFSQKAPFVTMCHYFFLPSPSRVTVQKVTKPFGKSKNIFWYLHGFSYHKHNCQWTKIKFQLTNIESNKPTTYMYSCFTSKWIFILKLRYTYVDFLWQAQNIPTMCLYLRILNFVVLLNNGSSLYIQMKPIISPGEYDTKCSWWIKKEPYCLRHEVSLNWPVCFGLFLQHPRSS